MFLSRRSNLSRVELIAWAFYDWASSAFPIIITTFVFATYFTSHVAENEITGTFQWANATAIAGILIAISGPLFGAIADYSGHHKRWLLLFTWICIIFTSLLWYVYPEKSSVPFALFCVIVSTVALEIAIIFYNSFLPHLSPPHYIGRISGWAWGLGYVGGIAALSITLFGFIQSEPAWLNTQTAEQVRICGPMVAVWFLIFSLPLFIWVKDTPAGNSTIRHSIKMGLKDLFLTLKTLPAKKNLTLFLLAHLIYIDGLNTLFAFGGIYAAGTFGMNMQQVILFGITMNISAGLGAILFAWMDDFRGAKPTILISLIFLILLGLPILWIHDVVLFWILGLCLSLFLGPVQAASRSLMARMASPGQATQLFGLYALSGKITAFLGPWLLGIVTLWAGSQRAGIAIILAFFLVGAVLMLFVKEEKAIL